MNTIFGAAYVVVVAVATFKFALSKQNAIETNEHGHMTKRSIPAVEALLKTAKLRYTQSGVKIYTKSGSYSKALKDFKRLRPKEVEISVGHRW